MSLIQELDPPPAADAGPAASLFSVSQSPFTIREVPIVLRGNAAVPPTMEVTLHYQRVHIEGLADLIPDQVELDISSLAEEGGAIRIDQLPLPPCCEVIGVWFTNPVVTVAPS